MQQQNQALQPLKKEIVITGLKPYYNTKAKLPNKRFPFPCKNIALPLCDQEIIKKDINNTLAQLEGVRGEYNEKKYMWNLEYGTKPIELTIDKADYKLRRIIDNKKYAALLASSKALEKFPHNADYYNDDFDDDDLPSPIPLFANGKWCNIQIYLTYDEEKNIILIEFNRYDGDPSSYYFVVNAIESTLKAPTFNNLISRSNFLTFAEGIEYNPTNPILKYLCDDIVKREICGYL
jgi:hypothetical protein